MSEAAPKPASSCCWSTYGPSHTRTGPGEDSLTCSRRCPHVRARHCSLAGSNAFPGLSFQWIELPRELTGKISSLPPATVCQETGAPAGSASWCSRAAANAHLSPRQVHSPAGWRLSKPAAGLGEAPEPCRSAGTTPPSPGRTWLRTHPGRWLISSQLEVKGCRSQGPAPGQQVRGSLQPGWQR